MLGNRLTKRELIIIERTKREGEEMYAREKEGAGSNRANNSRPGGSKVRAWRFYLWFIAVFVALIAGLSLMMILMPGR